VERGRGGRPGELIGLSILEERARRIGARLEIDSEPGEGTRVELRFEPSRSKRLPSAEEAA
jgi:two-component system nitrate/nitrite sensor histidine kinase NarX